jgi:pimeloyl-ACP methyl ester carboxylesterase
MLTSRSAVARFSMPSAIRREVYERGEANILFVLEQLKALQPNADYGHLTLVGHSNGGDISMFCAKRHPELVSNVITLDNLRVPFVLSNKLKILSFRSKDPNFKTDPGVLPTPEQAKADGIDIVKTNAQHTDMSDRGPDSVKEGIQAALDHFLSDSAASELTPVNTDHPVVSKGVETPERNSVLKKGQGRATAALPLLLFKPILVREG